MEKLNEIKEYAKLIRLTLISKKAEEYIHTAQIEKATHMDFLHQVLKSEYDARQNKQTELMLKMAKLPPEHDLDVFDYKHYNGINKQELKELRELIWMENRFNLVLMGPSGVGKSFIASGLIHDAINLGYKAYFRTMDEIIEILKMKDMVIRTKTHYDRLLNADLLAIDDIMLFPMKKNEAVSFFNMINQLHGNCSVIITTNKSPKQWAETLEDEILATALLDRLLYRCEIVKLSGSSYRMDNRKTIFNKTE